MPRKTKISAVASKPRESAYLRGMQSIPATKTTTTNKTGDLDPRALYWDALGERERLGITIGNLRYLAKQVNTTLFNEKLAKRISALADRLVPVSHKLEYLEDDLEAAELEVSQ